MRSSLSVQHEGWVARDAAVVWHGFTQMAAWADNAPIVVERAEGRELIDVDGRRYFDAVSSLWVVTLGHRVAELDTALVEQLGRVAHSTMLGNGNRVVVELAEALAAAAPVDRPHILFASDGASAVEQALKIAFQHHINVGRAGRNANLGHVGRTRYLALGDAYHGDTVGSLSLGAGGFGTDLFDPLRFPVLRTPGYADPAWADAAVAALERHADSLAAFVLEPLVQGAAGMQVAAPDDVRRVVRAAQDHGVLVIADEVATGFGRTGTLFASEQCGIRPDLLCLGKGLTGGYLPLSATLASQRVYDAFLGDDLGPRTLYHGHSYGGNALAAAVALRHLQLLQEWDVLANVRARSTQLHELLAGRDARICGLMAGFDVESGKEARRLCAEAVRQGVFVRPLGETIVLVPPLTTTGEELARVVEVVLAA